MQGIFSVKTLSSRKKKKQRKSQGINPLNSWIDPALTDSISGLFFYERK
jgi:hypothetical protein